MAIAKVQFKESASAAPEVWMDTTQKTVTAGTMLSGTTALKNDGTGITGNIASKSSSDLTASGATVSAPAGFYAESASKTVASGSASTPATSITANPTISVNASGLITASVSGSKSVTPTISAGYVTSGTAGTISVSGSNTEQLSTQAGTTITPTESEQTAVASGKYTTGAVKVGAISSTYVGSGITQRDSTDLTASGGTVTAPAGYYAEAASKSVASGSVGTPTATKGTVSNHSISVTPSVTNTTGYITGSTISGTAVTIDVTELESGTKSITANGTGISVSGYSAVDVDVPGQEPTGIKYIWTDVDGNGAWDVGGYKYCAVDGAPIKDSRIRLWLDLENDTNVSIKLNRYSTSGVVDWGDGNTEEWSSSPITHSYSTTGRYVVEIFPTSGQMYLDMDSRTIGQSSSAPDTKIFYAEVYSYNYNSRPYVFTYCSNLRRAYIGSAYTTIGTDMFSHCTNLEYIKLPSSITSIGQAAFDGCVSLMEFEIGENVTSLASVTFRNCSSLKTLHVKATTPPTIGNSGTTSPFYGCPSDMIIYVPYSADHSIISAYKSATNWSTYASQMQEEPQ